MIAALGAVAGPAGAHEADPTIVTTLDSIRPPLPAGIVIQVQASVAEELVADNPTAAPLEVVAEGGEPFLRLSSAGVFANVSSRSWYASNSPLGTVPPAAETRLLRLPRPAPPEWTRVSRKSGWGWFDHRLHPAGLRVPPELLAAHRAGVFGSWRVPMTYGGKPVAVTGSLTYRPLLGGFFTRADPVPAGLALTFDVLPARLPGALATYSGSTQLSLLGVDGGPYLRFSPQGVQAWTASPSYIADQQAKGSVPRPEPARWVTVSRTPSFSWLDRRLAYPGDLPAADVLASTKPSIVLKWSIPVVTATSRFTLTGDISWVPNPGDIANAAHPAKPAEAWAAILLLVSAAVALGAIVGWLVRQRGRAARSLRRNSNAAS